MRIHRTNSRATILPIGAYLRQFHRELPNRSFQVERALRSDTIGKSIFLFTSIALIILALTGFVCAHKIQAEEECLSSNVQCYECDSRFDPNCADPFDFFTQEEQQQQPPLGLTNSNISLVSDARTQPQNVQPNETNQVIPNVPKPAKKLPPTVVCHGCCVKLTSKIPDGSVYVKRTCTTNLQINYFMVGLVCMKESGDRGKMCFCETDYCNGQPSSRLFQSHLVTILLLGLSTRYMTRFH